MTLVCLIARRCYVGAGQGAASTSKLTKLGMTALPAGHSCKRLQKMYVFVCSLSLAVAGAGNGQLTNACFGLVGKDDVS